MLTNQISATHAGFNESIADLEGTIPIDKPPWQ